MQNINKIICGTGQGLLQALHTKQLKQSTPVEKSPQKI
jgi:hypothetical protein